MRFGGKCSETYQDKARRRMLILLPTNEGWLYLAVIIELYSRKVVGWSMNKSMPKQLVINALDMAVKNRKPPKG